MFMSIGLWAQEAVSTRDCCLGQVYAGTVCGQSSPYQGDSTRFSEVVLGNPTSTCIPWVDW